MLTNKEIEDFIAEREEARRVKNFILADKIREILLKNNVYLEDEKTRTFWGKDVDKAEKMRSRITLNFSKDTD